MKLQVYLYHGESALLTLLGTVNSQLVTLIVVTQQ